MDPAIHTACANLSTSFSPVRFGAQLDQLREQVHDKATYREIENFLIDFNKSLNSFKILYGVI
jgi:hypothetical protein